MACLAGEDAHQVGGEGERADRGGAGRDNREPALETLQANRPAGLSTVLEAAKLGRSEDHGRKEEEESEGVDGYESSGEPESHPAAKLLLLTQNIISFQPSRQLF